MRSRFGISSLAAALLLAAGCQYPARPVPIVRTPSGGLARIDHAAVFGDARPQGLPASTDAPALSANPQPVQLAKQPGGPPSAFQTASYQPDAQREGVTQPEFIPSPEDFLLPGPRPQSPRPVLDCLPGGPLGIGSQPLSLADFEQMALEQNPAVAQMSAYVQSLRGKWLQVGLPPNPSVYYTGGEIGDNNTLGQQGGYISQQFITGGKLRLNRVVVSREIATAEQRQAAMALRVLTDVRTGYYDVLIAQRRLDTTAQLEQIGRQLQETTSKLHNAQEVSLAVLLQAQVEADSIALLHFNAGKNHLAAWRRLTTVLGAPNLPLQQVADLAGNHPPRLDWETTLARLESQSPQVATAAMDLERARAALARAEVEYIPNIQAQAGMQYDNVEKNEIAMVQIGLPVPIINRNQGGVRQARSEVLAAQRNLDRVTLSLERRLANTFRDYENAHNQVEQYSGSILPNARRSLDLISQGFANGEVEYLTLLTAQRTYYHTNLAYLDSLRELWVRISEIEGMLLEDSLDNPPPQ